MYPQYMYKFFKSSDAFYFADPELVLSAFIRPKIPKLPSRDCGKKVEWPKIKLLMKIHNFKPIIVKLGENDKLMRR